jgi:hypothetical protein
MEKQIVMGLNEQSLLGVHFAILSNRSLMISI